MQGGKHGFLLLIFQRAQEIAHALPIVRKCPDPRKIFPCLSRTRNRMQTDETHCTIRAECTPVLDIGRAVRTARWEEKIQEY